MIRLPIIAPANPFFQNACQELYRALMLTKNLDKQFPEIREIAESFKPLLATRTPNLSEARFAIATLHGAYRLADPRATRTHAHLAAIYAYPDDQLLSLLCLTGESIKLSAANACEVPFAL